MRKRTPPMGPNTRMPSRANGSPPRTTATIAPVLGPIGPLSAARSGSAPGQIRISVADPSPQRGACRPTPAQGPETMVLGGNVLWKNPVGTEPAKNAKMSPGSNWLKEWVPNGS